MEFNKAKWKEQMERFFDLMDEKKIRVLQSQLISSLNEKSNIYFAEAEKHLTEYLLLTEDGVKNEDEAKKAEEHDLLYKRYTKSGQRLHEEAIAFHCQWSTCWELVDKETDEILKEIQEQVNKEKENGVQA